jgi:hypothetical protein
MASASGEFREDVIQAKVLLDKGGVGQESRCKKVFLYCGRIVERARARYLTKTGVASRDHGNIELRILHAILSGGFYGSERYCIDLAIAQSILEAMAARCPLIVTRTDGPNEFLNDPRVLWSEPDHHDELAMQLLKVAKRRRERFEYDMSQFTVDRASHEVEEFYQCILRARNLSIHSTRWRSLP